MANIRSSSVTDLEQAINLINQVFRLDNNKPPSMHKQFPVFLSEQNIDNIYIAEEDNRVVSHNGISKNNIKINGYQLPYASMGAVCTHPDYRGKGIATNLLNFIFDKLNQEKIGLLAISGGRGLYLRNGAVPTSGCTRYLFEKEDLSILPENNSLNFNYYNKVPQKDIMQDICKLYQEKPTRYQRLAVHFPVLFEAMPPANDIDYPPDRFLATASAGDGSVLAYVLGFLNRSRLKIIEYGGESEAVLQILSYSFSDKVRSILLTVPYYHHYLITRLKEYGFPGDSNYFPGTYKIINRDVLWKSLLPLMQERCPEEDFEIRLQDLPIGDSDEELIHFLFDVYEREDHGQPWDKIFPLPLPWPCGLNYI